MLPFKNGNFSNTAKAILDFSLLLPIYLYCSPFISLLQILYEFCRLVHGFFSILHPYSYRSSNYCDSNSWRSFTRNSDNHRYSDGRMPSKKKQRTDTKKDAKRIKSNNFTRRNRDKSNIDIALLERWMIWWHHNYFVFWW